MKTSYYRVLLLRSPQLLWMFLAGTFVILLLTSPLEAARTTTTTIKGKIAVEQNNNDNNNAMATHELHEMDGQNLNIVRRNLRKNPSIFGNTAQFAKLPVKGYHPDEIEKRVKTIKKDELKAEIVGADASTVVVFLIVGLIAVLTSCCSPESE